MGTTDVVDALLQHHSPRGVYFSHCTQISNNKLLSPVPGKGQPWTEGHEKVELERSS